MVTFNETETQQETSTDYGFRRTNSNAVLDNQLNFTETAPYTNYSSYQTTKEEEEETSPSYEVEREYNIDKLPEDEVIIPTFMPTLHVETPTTEANDSVKLKLNARGKIMASVFGVVVCLLIAFMIYNAVLIGNLSSKLESLETAKQSQRADVSSLKTSYQSMTSDSAIKSSATENGFIYSDRSQDIVISLESRPEIKSAEKTTNWFNNICEFFSELFN